jgi:RHS repeat-associated protein
MIYHSSQWNGVTWPTYDAAGNDTTGNKIFDAENRITTINGSTYLYDGNSRRSAILTSGARVHYIYAATGALLLIDNWTAGTTQKQIYFNGDVVATQDQDDVVHYLMKDYLGSVRTVVDVTSWPNGWYINSAVEYKPFGLYDRQSNTGYGYAGKLDNSGLMYFGARYYDEGFDPSSDHQTSSRWMSADPILSRPYDPQSLNKYSYVRNDPVNFIDPDGKTYIPVIRVVVGIQLIDFAAKMSMSEIYGYHGREPFLDIEMGSDQNSGQRSAMTWDSLSPTCQKGLIEAMSGNGAGDNQLRIAALQRAMAAKETLQKATSGTPDIPWQMLAAIGIRETGFVDKTQKIQDKNGNWVTGGGRGVFQIDIIENPSVKESQAKDLSWAANWAANTLKENYKYFMDNTTFEGDEQLYQATAASWNLGLNGISGNSSTIDLGSPGNNYGINILHLMDCF